MTFAVTDFAPPSFLQRRRAAKERRELLVDFLPLLDEVLGIPSGWAALFYVARGRSLRS